MKRSIKNMPIRRKVTLVILLTCVTALVMVGLALFAVQVFTFRHEFAANLQSIAEIIEFVEWVTATSLGFSAGLGRRICLVKMVMAFHPRRGSRG